MEILVNRFGFKSNSTLSQFFVNGSAREYILEDKDRGLRSDMTLDEIQKIKVWGQTAIPTGRYRVTMRYSPKFKRWLPYLNNVPGFEYIMIHPGNFIKDTLGCLLPGQSYSVFKNEYLVNNSRKVANPLIREINDALERGEEVWCEISQA
ncbi:DUF5675 family protein [Arundinibacter roseus]|uniref:DUF5675 domain-containing protein n=1 Tax=Arundinibacter roseus TaxID=2070510 RepID=A0A4R4KMA3_9BACT|nr:DUF5675 family protein [Arundinibacter roseus]TDB69123.1 hypothetical protein EZE20_01950 [Arundinibacter roseus]